MVERLSAAEQRAVETWVHAMLHLKARKGLDVLPEGEWVAECWMPSPPPEWALESARSGAPGSAWCPILSPHLGHMSEVQGS